MRLRHERTSILTAELARALAYGPNGEGFTEAQLERAWRAHREQLLGQERGSGSRPWAFWRFDAGRPEHSEDFPHGDDEAADCWTFDPVIWLAERGELRDEEIAEIRAEAEIAAPRIGTDEERFRSPADSRDRSAVRLARAVDAALGGGPDGSPDWGVGRERQESVTYQRPRRARRRKGTR